MVNKLEDYFERGVRVLFPVHKMDNAFSAGDGDRRVSDIGNYAHTGHYSNENRSVSSQDEKPFKILNPITLLSLQARRSLCVYFENEPDPESQAA